MSPNAGGGGSCGVSANEYSCAHGAQINFGDPTPYLTYGKIKNVQFSAYKNLRYTLHPLPPATCFTVSLFLSSCVRVPVWFSLRFLRPWHCATRKSEKSNAPLPFPVRETATSSGGRGEGVPIQPQYLYPPPPLISCFVTCTVYASSEMHTVLLSAVLEFLNNLWGLRTE